MREVRPRLPGNHNGAGPEECGRAAIVPCPAWGRGSGLERPAAPGGFPYLTGRGRVRGPGAPPRCTGLGRVPTRDRKPPRGRGRLSGQLPGPGTQGRYPHVSRPVARLARRRGLPNGTEGAGPVRPAADPRETGLPHARTTSGRKSSRRPVAPARCRAERPAREIPTCPRIVRPRGQDAEGGG